jgi:hypothetical protein
MPGGSILASVPVLAREYKCPNWLLQEQTPNICNSIYLTLARSSTCLASLFLRFEIYFRY